MSVRRLSELLPGEATRSVTDGRVRADNSEAVGHEYASEMFYPDGRRVQIRADKVLDTPTRRAQQFDAAIRSPHSGGIERSHASLE